MGAFVGMCELFCVQYVQGASAWVAVHLQKAPSLQAATLELGPLGPHIWWGC